MNTITANILENISLKSFNTFDIDVIAKRFISVNSIEQLIEIIKEEKDVLLISGGSNILLTKDIESLVVHINFKGIRVEQENENEIYLTVNAGENWHNFVLWCISKNYGGVENLSLIPGNVGTSPIQNIGAYGVEIKNVITKVEALEIETGNIKIFSNSECGFQYRSSIFKNEAKGKYIITSVSFRLTKKNHVFNTSYGAIEDELKVRKVKKHSLKSISEAVIAIRKSKLPDTKIIGNSGSFFKNPVISKNKFLELKLKYPSVPNYKVSKTEVKVPAGWLIEKAGFKGKRYQNYGVYDKQALILVNYGGATGKEIYSLALKIMKDIYLKFGINLELEVNVIL